MLLPGTGLIIRRREWLGFCLVILYGVSGNVVLAGWLIAPDSVPSWMWRVAVGMTAVTWLLSQWLYRRQAGLLARHAAAARILLRDARAALESGDLAAARAALESGRSLDDENAELRGLSQQLEAASASSQPAANARASDQDRARVAAS